MPCIPAGLRTGAIVLPSAWDGKNFFAVFAKAFSGSLRIPVEIS